MTTGLSPYGSTIHHIILLEFFLKCKWNSFETNFFVECTFYIKVIFELKHLEYCYLDYHVALSDEEDVTALGRSL